MYRIGGIRPFFAGTIATMTRDLLFGGTFAVLRHLSYDPTKNSTHPHDNNNNNNNKSLANHANELYINLFAASVATIVSSPHNYVRNIH